MGILSRLFKFFQSSAHSAIDKIEDPVKLTEQGIRDLKKDLQASMVALAEAKALGLRLERDGAEKKQLGQEYERKAILLLERAKSGLLDQAEADRLASEALQKKALADKQAQQSTSGIHAQSSMTQQMEANIKKLQAQITTWEAELLTLKSRSKVASATKKLNEQIAQVNSSGTIAMLERMKTKVKEDEALAESYGNIAMLESSVDDEINKALAQGSVPQEDALRALKARLDNPMLLPPS